MTEKTGQTKKAEETPAETTAELATRLCGLIDAKFTEANAFAQRVNDALTERLGAAENALAELETRIAGGGAKYPDNVRDYAVEPGDTLVKIAKSELANPGNFTKIATMNYDRYPSLRKSNRVEPGWVLRLPAR